MRVIRYLLTLTACVLLALPTGWCCLLALTAPATALVTAKVNAERCGSCCTHQEPGEDEAPARVPMSWCCCDNLVALRKDGPPDQTPDLVVAALPQLSQPLAPEPQTTSAAPLCLSPPRPLHVLRCLWLC
ncbi:MAG: hypothetical protein U0797_28325 [Gemmataceae bacterium]